MRKDKSVKQLICQQEGTFVLRSNGDLFGCGNLCGVHQAEEKSELKLLAAGEDIERMYGDGLCFTIFERKNGDLHLISDESPLDRPSVLLAGKRVKDISCAATHLLVLLESRELYGKGRNDCG